MKRASESNELRITFISSNIHDCDKADRSGYALKILYHFCLKSDQTVSIGENSLDAGGK